jgi:broad specificity phosphatase PhoE
VARPCRDFTGFLPRLAAELGGIVPRRQDLSEPALATRLVFLCHAATRFTREGGFPSPDEPIDDGGSRKAEALVLRPAPRVVVSAPALAARQTAEVLGLSAAIAPALVDSDHGRWRGQSLSQVRASDLDGLMGWLDDPASGAPEGEAFVSVLARVAAWMDEQAASDSRILAITHPTVMRAALAHVLDIPPPAAFRIDIAPLSMLTLSFNRIWRFQGLGDQIA